MLRGLGVLPSIGDVDVPSLPQPSISGSKRLTAGSENDYELNELMRPTAGAVDVSGVQNMPRRSRSAHRAFSS